MTNYKILTHKDWTCEISKYSFNLSHSGNELIDSYDAYSELISTLAKYLCRKHKLNCGRRNFRIENDENDFSVLITQRDSHGFLEFLQSVSTEISKIQSCPSESMKITHMQALEGRLSKFSLN